MTNRKVFGVEVALNTPIPFNYSESVARITQLDYTDALYHSPFGNKVMNVLQNVILKETPAQLDKWLVTEKSDYMGSWSKRFQKYIKKQYDLNLEPQPLSIMVELIGKALKSMVEPIVMEITDHSNWKPGQFGDPGSCWFDGTHSKDRLGLLAQGGGAVLFYTPRDGNSPEPRGRMWYYPLDGGNSCVIFNVYDKRGTFTLLNVARILSIQFNVGYRRVSQLYFPEAYINGSGSSYMVGNNLVDRPITLTIAQTPIKVTNPSGFLPYDTVAPSKGNYTCDDCGCSTDDITKVGNRYRTKEKHVCETCLQNYVKCTDCDDYDAEDNGTRVNGEWKCSECQSDYDRCYHCDNMFHRDDIEYIENYDRHVCSSCIDRRYRYCDMCDSHAEEEDVHEGQHGGVCNDCIEHNSLVRCDHCDKYTAPEELQTVHDTTHSTCELCESCINSEPVNLCIVCDEWFYDELNHDCTEEEADE